MRSPSYSFGFRIGLYWSQLPVFVGERRFHEPATANWARELLYSAFEMR